MLVLSEGVELLVNDEIYPVPKGSLLTFGPMDLHLIRYSGKESYKRFVVWFKEDFLSELEPVLNELLRCFYIRRTDKENLLLLTKEEFSKVFDIFNRLKAAEEGSPSLLTKLTLGELLTVTNNLKESYHTNAYGEVRHGALYSAMRFIRENLHKKISQDELAKITGRNKRALCNDFITVTGMSTGQYILNCRLTSSKAYLVQGLSVSEVCEKTGFENWSNFSRTFKNHVGISPKQYAMKYRK
jgi:AraC-like DNA-binding protein